MQFFSAKLSHIDGCFATQSNCGRRFQRGSDVNAYPLLSLRPRPIALHVQSPSAYIGQRFEDHLPLSALWIHSLLWLLSNLHWQRSHRKQPQFLRPPCSLYLRGISASSLRTAYSSGHLGLLQGGEHTMSFGVRSEERLAAAANGSSAPRRTRAHGC